MMRKSQQHQQGYSAVLGSDSASHGSSNSLGLIDEHFEEEEEEEDEFHDDKENQDHLNVGILAGMKRIQAENTVTVSKLDETKLMKQMDIWVHGERRPKDVWKRRSVAIVLLLLFSGMLLGIIIGEAVYQPGSGGLVAKATRSKTRNDVFLVSFAKDGATVSWNETILIVSQDFTDEVISALSKIPFADFSIELRYGSSNDPLILACIEEEHKKISSSSSSSAQTCSPLVQEMKVDKITFIPCSKTHASALKTGVKCTSRLNGKEQYEALSRFWASLFEQAKPGWGMSTRCCDFDQIFEGSGDVLQICEAPLSEIDSSLKNFFRYHGKEDLTLCQLPLCGCQCFTERKRNAKTGCPSVPAKYQKMPDMCAQLETYMQSKQQRVTECTMLPTELPSTAAENNWEMPLNPRCYGEFTRK